MASRIPVVMNSGEFQQLQTGDTLSTASAPPVSSYTSLDPAIADDVLGDQGAVNAKFLIKSLLGIARWNPGYRLTTESGVPVSTSNRAGIGTIYLTPTGAGGLALPLYQSSVWTLFNPGELSYSISATSGLNYDLFFYNNSGTPALLRGPAWASDTSRGTGAGTTELELFQGHLVNKVAISSTSAREALYVGTFRASASNVSEDSTTKRFVWSFHGQAQKPLSASRDTNTHTYTSVTYREWRGGGVNQRVEWVQGQAGMTTLGATATVGNGGIIAPRLDAVTAPTGGAFIYQGGTNSSAGTTYEDMFTAAGYHFGAIVQAANIAGSGDFFAAQVRGQLWC